jgi:hypothetical protein
MTTERKPTVFISYSHDSEEHAARVLALADRLIADGVDCILDQYEGDPPEGWPRWMDRKIKEADFVIMICTETYFNRVMGKEQPGVGRGVKWEGNLIYQHIYQAESENRKFIPVLFADGKVEHIPPVTSIDELAGDFWPEDESVDDFIDYIYGQRRENQLKD